jgi:hypothetical protein
MNDYTQFIHGTGIFIAPLKQRSKITLSFKSSTHSPLHHGVRSVIIRPKAKSFNKMAKQYLYNTIQTATHYLPAQKYKTPESNKMLVSSSIQTNRVARLLTAKLAKITLLDRIKPQVTELCSFSPQINRYEKDSSSRVSPVSITYSSIAKIKRLVKAKDVLLYKEKQHSCSTLKRIKDWLLNNTNGRNNQLKHSPSARCAKE